QGDADGRAGGARVRAGRERRGAPARARRLARPRLLDATRELFDLALRVVEPGPAQRVELLATLPERERLVERRLPVLEPFDDLLELDLRLLEGQLTHGRPRRARRTLPPRARRRRARRAPGRRAKRRRRRPSGRSHSRGAASPSGRVSRASPRALRCGRACVPRATSARAEDARAAGPISG